MIPRFPVTSFFIFCKAKRLTVSQKHPELTSRQVAKKLGQNWKAMSEKKKVINMVKGHGSSKAGNNP